MKVAKLRHEDDKVSLLRSLMLDVEFVLSVKPSDDGPFIGKHGLLILFQRLGWETKVPTSPK